MVSFVTVRKATTRHISSNVTGTLPSKLDIGSRGSKRGLDKVNV
jgi:hypothetical protein